MASQERIRDTVGGLFVAAFLVFQIQIGLEFKKGRKGLGGSQLGLVVGSTSRPTKSSVILKAQSLVRV